MIIRAIIAAFIVLMVADVTPAEAHVHKHRVVSSPTTCFFICNQEIARPLQHVRHPKNAHQRRLARRGKYLQQHLPIGVPTYSNNFGLIAKARSYMGETASQIGLNRSTDWCSAFLRYISGASGVDDRAISWLNRPHVSKEVGAVAVMRHHVGIVTGFDDRGNPILVSGNHGHRVGEGVYASGRIIAYVSA